MSTAEQQRRAAPQSGLARVAAISFLAARAAPAAGFAVSLAGGVALARAGQRLGARRGYGASLAAMVQSVAVIGPARLGVPLTQALSAPLLGRMDARRTRLPWQILACFAIRLVENAAITAFFIWVIVGGLDAYAGSYDAVIELVPFLPVGPGAALELTIVGIVVWSVFASTVQVLVYRRGLRRWGTDAPERVQPPPAPLEPSTPGRFDPRAVTVGAAIAFGLLISSTAAGLLAGVFAWLVVSTLAARRLDRRALSAGLALTAVLALSGFGFAMVGGLGIEVALRRGARAGLLVLVATWLRAVAGSEGLREVSRRALGRLERVPSLREAAQALDELGSAPRLASAGRSLLAAVRSAPNRPLALLDAVLAWVAAETGRFQIAAAEAPAALALRARDIVLVGLAAAPVAALPAG